MAGAGAFQNASRLKGHCEELPGLHDDGSASAACRTQNRPKKRRGIGAVDAVVAHLEHIDAREVSALDEARLIAAAHGPVESVIVDIACQEGHAPIGTRYLYPIGVEIRVGNAKRAIARQRVLPVENLNRSTSQGERR